jgi:anti-anti-sigma factor
LGDWCAVGEAQWGGPGSAMSFHAAEHDTVTVLRLVGEHDMASAGLLERRIDDASGAGRNVVVSLQDITFLDSGIVAALYRSDARMRRRGLRLVLHCGRDSVVHRLLQMTSLVDVVTTAATLPAAV